MGWQVRGEHRYYSRSRRSDGKVVREYVGRGPAAELEAAADVESRVARQAERASVDAAAAELAVIDAMVNAACRSAETLARGTLLVAGYHRHSRGAWRRRRA
jgi:hypothetical protein